MLGYEKRKKLLVNDLTLKHISNIIKILLDTNEKQNKRMESLENMISNILEKDSLKPVDKIKLYEVE